MLQNRHCEQIQSTGSKELLTAGLCGFLCLRRSVGCMAVMVRSLLLTFMSLFSANKWQDVCFPAVAEDAEG